MTDDAQFYGQAVSIWSKEPARGAMLENVRVERLGERTFLVGQVPDDGKERDPRAGATFWFPVDDVLMLTVYPNVEAARAAYAAREKEANREKDANAESSKKPGWRFWS